MPWRRLSFPAFIISILLFTGVARGQGRYELLMQGKQPLQSDTTNQQQGMQPLQNDMKNQEQWLQPLQSDMTKPEQRVLDSSKKMPKSISPTKNKKTATVSSFKKSAKALQLDVSIGGLAGLGTNQSSSSGSTSFLDGYLLESLHKNGGITKGARVRISPKVAFLAWGNISPTVLVRPRF